MADKKYDESVKDLFQKLLDLFSGQQQPVISPLPKGQKTPSPDPTPTPSPAQAVEKTSKKNTDDSDIQKMLTTTFGEDGDIATAVAQQESSMNPKARNPKNPDVIGLMQIDVKAHSKIVPGDTMDEKIQNLEDPKINIAVAKQIYDQQGWSPWEAFTSGAYQKHLKKG